MGLSKMKTRRMMKTETEDHAPAKAAAPLGPDPPDPSTHITPKMSPIKWDGDEGELEVAEFPLLVKSDNEDEDETREAVESNVETEKKIVYVAADETNETFDTHNQSKGATTSEGTRLEQKLPKAINYASLPEAKKKRRGGRPKGSKNLQKRQKVPTPRPNTRKRAREEDQNVITVV